MTPVEELLPGSNVTLVVKVGETVRRPRRPSSEAVQALLGHLRGTGFDGCPEPLGFDERGREVLSYVEGHGGLLPLRPETTTDSALAEQAMLIRRPKPSAASSMGSARDYPCV